MKKSDIAMIILIASASMLIAYFVAKGVVGDVQNQVVKVKTAQSISSDVSEPDKAIFNSNAINPTVEVIIGSQTGATTNPTTNSSSQ
ncbi:MAG: hypothetical protein ABIQ04_05075 [Candidatus Saccharimonadales bacterium]